MSTIYKCCTSRPTTAENAAVSGARSETSPCSRSGGNMLSVRRSGYSADWVWPGCHGPCSKLARVETIWVMVTDSTIDSGSTSACLPHQIPRSPSHRLLADGLCQHGCRQAPDDHLTGKGRHNYGQKMTPDGLPAY